MRNHWIKSLLCLSIAAISVSSCATYAEAALQAVHLTVLVTRQQMEIEQLALNQSLGFPPERTVPLEADATLPEVAKLPALTTIMNGIEDRRLDLLALKMGYESQDARVRAAILAQFPKINIGFLQARDNSNVVSTGFAVGIDLPFFDRNQGQIAMERATRKKLFDEYVDRLFEARSNVATILANMASIKEQIGATENALPTLKDVVEKYRRALLEGMADVLSYYNIVNELITKRLELLRLKQSLMDQNIALEIAADRYLGGEEAKGVLMGIATGAVGFITSPAQAEQITATGQADVVLLAREMPRNPYWPLQAAQSLRVDVPWPKQYERAKFG